MKKLKVSLVVLGLLLTGFVAGFITNRMLIHKHLQRMHQMDEHHGFGQFLMNKLDATPEQTADLKPILQKYGAQFHALRKEAMEQRQIFSDSLTNELRPYLKEDQLKALDHFQEFLKRGPGPPPPPPKKDKRH